MSDQSRELASQLSEPFNVAFAGSFAAWFHRLNGSMQLAQEHAEKAIATSIKYEMPMFLGFGKIALGWSYIGQGKIEEGVSVAREGTDTLRASGALLGRIWNWGILAEGYGKAGQTQEALTLLDEALTLSVKTGERFYDAELWRLKGELVLKDSRRASDVRGGTLL